MQGSKTEYLLMLEAAAASSAEGIIIVDYFSYLIFINDAARKLIRRTLSPDLPLDQQAKSLGLRYPDGRRMAFAETPLGRALQGNIVTDETFRLLMPDDKEICLQGSADPVVNRSGRIIGAVYIFRGAEETAEDRLRQAEEERLKLLEQVERWAAELDIALSSIADGLAIYNAAGLAVRMNAAAKRMLGCSDDYAGEEVNTRAARLDARDASGRLFNVDDLPVRRALRGETVCNAIMALDSPETGKIWVSASAAPLCSAGRGVVGAIVTFTDITALQNLQQQREDLLHTVSHDLRNPLSLIQGHAQLIKRALQEDEKCINTATMSVSVSAIINSARRMNVMIQDLVDATRMSAGCMDLKHEPVDMSRFIEDLLEQFLGVIDTSRIELSLQEDLPNVMADPARLERIMSNLLSNALKYSDDKVIIETEAYPERLQISIVDRGMGITEEEMPYIFDRFYRTREAARTEGLGLGLYVTKKLIEAHGGDLWAESRAGEGSAFRFTLPVS
ncbi:MAG: ATP-binding protein [bacterium]|nr:ATP-binding protein [bacterium]